MQTFLWYFCWIICGTLLCTVVVVLCRTFALTKGKADRTGAAPYDPGAVDAGALARLGKAISIPTVSNAVYEETNFAPFDEYNEFIQQAFPLFHQNTTRTMVNKYAMVYLWKGTDSTLAPMMLTAHYDVVPVEAGTEGDWEQPPFSGAVVDGRIWGRGTLDIKSQMTAQMEAAEALMREGYVPRRDFYFVYGHDEEVGGMNGAARVSEYFEKEGIRLEGVLDEGGFAVSGVIKGVDAPLALVGVAEKGFCNYHITTPGEGGHSSMPPAHTALGNLASLIATIEKNPMPARLTPPVLEMLNNIAGEMGFAVRMAVANLWLFRPLLLKILCQNNATAALVRTSFAATMAKASDAANVLPLKATGTVNARLLHGDDLASVQRYIENLAGGRPVEIATTVGQQPSNLSPTSGRAWQNITARIADVYPGVIATPYLVMGGTDARKYYNVCDNVYRFTPILVSNEEKNAVHSTNESVTVENYGRMIYFYEEYIRHFED